MLLTNRLFFEQVEAMLAEGHEVQIRMKGHSMRPLLRNERDIAVLTPIAKYAPAPVPAAGASADPVPETRAADGNASTARQTRLSGDTPGTAPDLHTPACGTRHPAPPPSGIGALRHRRPADGRRRPVPLRRAPYPAPHRRDRNRRPLRREPSRMRTSRRECPVPGGIRGKPRREGFRRGDAPFHPVRGR